MLEYEANDAQIHASCAKFDANIREEASIILWTIWRPTRPQYGDLPACLDALSEDLDLHEALKHAHATQNYDTIRNWCTLCRYMPYFSSNGGIALYDTALSSGAPAHQFQDSIVDDKVQKFLQEIEESIVQVVDGRVSLPVWAQDDASMNHNIRRHLTNLRIPTLKGKPNLLLHELGCFKNDPLLKRRLNNVFMPNNHTSVVLVLQLRSYLTILKVSC